jgi:hypothetical protein
VECGRREEKQRKRKRKRRRRRRRSGWIALTNKTKLAWKKNSRRTGGTSENDRSNELASERMRKVPPVETPLVPPTVCIN